MPLDTGSRGNRASTTALTPEPQLQLEATPRRRITRSARPASRQSSPTTISPPNSPSPLSQQANTTANSPPSSISVSTRTSPAASDTASTPTTPTAIPSTPTTKPATAHSESKSMLPRDTGSLRGRNIEDITDMEEKGLLMRRMSSNLSDGTSSDGVRRRREDRDDAAAASFEKIDLGDIDDRDQENGGGGLKSKRDKQAFSLLVVLYLLQGIPLGLTFGTLPFLLKPHISYSDLAIFALSTWPYSLKLLWSPIVDAWFVPKWGRRKSWVVPVQAVVGVGLWIIGGKVEGWLEAETIDIKLVTIVFGSLIFAAATQDIAVDGWALTLLSPPNLSYASTAQTIGLGIGTALSFTVFLAFNSVDFSNRYFRSAPLDYPLIALGPYLRFWAVLYIVVTAWLVFFKTEDPVSADDPDLDVRKVYSIMWSIIRLKNIQSFLTILLIAKFGFQVNESVTQLKLLEKGLSKEDLAVAVLLDFPAQMIVGWLAAKWSRPTPPTVAEARHPLTAGNGRAAAAASGVLRVWIAAFWARLIMATIAATVVWAFPRGPVGSGYFTLVIATTLMTSLTNTVQFVGITAFHTQIADPLIGGTYMTLLNTVSNLGGTWPKPLILRAVDVLTVTACSTSGAECASERGRTSCLATGGQCNTPRDGYYIMSALCISGGVALLVWYILPNIRRLQALPLSAWRVKIPA